MIFYSWAKPFGHTVLGSQLTSRGDILTNRMPKTRSMWEKYVQILYSSLGISKIRLKCTKPTGSMGPSWTVHSLRTRIALETTALQVM